MRTKQPVLLDYTCHTPSALADTAVEAIQIALSKSDIGLSYTDEDNLYEAICAALGSAEYFSA